MMYRAAVARSWCRPSISASIADYARHLGTGGAGTWISANGIESEIVDVQHRVAIAKAELTRCLPNLNGLTIDGIAGGRLLAVGINEKNRGDPGIVGELEHRRVDSDGSRRGFRFDVGHRSDLKPATIPI